MIISDTSNNITSGMTLSMGSPAIFESSPTTLRVSIDVMDFEVSPRDVSFAKHASLTVTVVDNLTFQLAKEPVRIKQLKR